MTALDERRMDRFIGVLLRAGVLASAALVAVGTLLSVAQGGGSIPAYRAFSSGAADLRTVAGVFHAALHGSGRGIVQLGVLLLVATPIARVLFSVVAFAAQRDATYVCMTLVVLAVLGFSLWGSLPLERETRARTERAAAERPPPAAALEPARLEATGSPGR